MACKGRQREFKQAHCSSEPCRACLQRRHLPLAFSLQVPTKSKVRDVSFQGDGSEIPRLRVNVSEGKREERRPEAAGRCKDGEKDGVRGDGPRVPGRRTAWARAAPGRGSARSRTARGERGSARSRAARNEWGRARPRMAGGSSPDARTHLAARTTPPRGPHHSTAPPPESASLGAQTLEVPRPHTRVSPRPLAPVIGYRTTPHPSIGHQRMPLTNLVLIGLNVKQCPPSSFRSSSL